MFALDVQSDLLSYLGQQSFTHAALVFAVLVAVFTFATGFDKKLRGKWACHSYFLVIFLMLFAAAYALGRTVLYGALAWKTILTDPATCQAKIHQNVTVTLSQYLSCINGLDYNSTDPFVRPFVQGVLFSYRNIFGPGMMMSWVLALWGTFVISRIAVPGKEFTFHDIKWRLIVLSLFFLLLAILLFIREIL